MRIENLTAIVGLVLTTTFVTGCAAPGIDVGAAAASVVSQSSASSTVPEVGGLGSAAPADHEPYATRTRMSLATPVGTANAPAPEAATSTPTPVADVAAGSGGQGADGAVVASDLAPDVPAAASTSYTRANEGAARVAVALTRAADVDPAPPLTVLVDGVWLVDGGSTYRVTGRIRNDGDEQYEGIGLEATFYDGSDWRFGAFDATVGCYSLDPGQSCAFAVGAYAREYTAYRLHPEGSPVKAWTGSSTGLTVTDIAVTGDAGGYVHLTGVVVNETGSSVTGVRISAELLDGAANVAGVSSTVLTSDLAPGAETPFIVRVPAEAFASYAVAAEGRLR